MIIRRTPNTVTVPEVFRELGMEPDKESTWSVGLKARNLWVKNHHSEPPKELRKKTCGIGVHCFAIYPVEFKPAIVDLIKASEAAEGRQMSLQM